MSRLGKKQLSIPSGTTCSFEKGLLSIKGPKGSQAVQVFSDVLCDVKDGFISFLPAVKTKRANVLWGLVRSLAANAIKGASEGFTTPLKMEGVGYRVALQGKAIKLQLGFSHDVVMPIPEGLDVKVKSTTEFSVSGVCKQKVGQWVSEIQSYRPPEPYKGKGVHRVGQYVLRKEGKKK